MRVWMTYEEAKFITFVFFNKFQSKREKAAIRPYELVSLKIDSVSYILNREFDFITDSARVHNGEWDKQGEPLAQKTFYTSFVAHFKYSIPWEETLYYQEKVQEIEAYSRTHSINGFKARLQKYDRIFQQIDQKGYQTQKELFTHTEDPILTERGVLLLSNRANIRHEIAVHIGRNGDFLLCDGRHRFSMVKILEIESVPARIVVRHEEWQQLRNEVARVIENVEPAIKGTEELRAHIKTKLEEELKPVRSGIDHPDLKRIIERRTE